MVWNCELCSKEVEVIATIQGDEVYPPSVAEEDIWKSLTQFGFGSLLLECQQCGSSKVVWR